MLSTTVSACHLTTLFAGATFPPYGAAVRYITALCKFTTLAFFLTANINLQSTHPVMFLIGTSICVHRTNVNVAKFNVSGMQPGNVAGMQPGIVAGMQPYSSYVDH